MTMPVLEIELKPSCWARPFFFLVQFFAALAISMLTSAWLWMGLLIWVGLVWHYRHLLSLNGTIRLKWDGAGWYYKSETCWEPVTLNHAVVWSRLVILNASRVDNLQLLPIIFFPYQCDKEQLRRLRVLLRHQPVFGDTLLGKA